MYNEIIEELLREKEELLKEKEANSAQIALVDQQIAYFESMCKQYVHMMVINNHHIKSYEEIIEVENEVSRFSLLTIPFTRKSYAKRRIREIRADSDRLVVESSTAQTNLSTYKKQRKALENQRIDINNKLFIIDDRLGKIDNIEEEKPKVLKKRR